MLVPSEGETPLPGPTPPMSAVLLQLSSEWWERWYQMTDEERTKQRNKERLEGDEAMMTFAIFFAASLAGGADAKKAAANADLAIAELKRRFA